MGLPNSRTAVPPSTKNLRSIGHETWLTMLYSFVDYLVGLLTVNVSAAWGPVNAMTTTALPANTYVHGTLTKTANANGALGTIDGVTLAVGSRVWDKDAATGAERGAFVVVSLGGASAKWSMIRAPDANASTDYVNGRTVAVATGGGTNGGQSFVLTNTTFTLDTTTPTLSSFGGGSGVTLGTDQTITGAKSFNDLALRIWNGAGSFATQFRSLATATRIVSLADVAGVLQPKAQTESKTGAGALAVAGTSLLITAAAGDALTLADGTYAGQRKSIVQLHNTHAGTDTSVITPTTFAVSGYVKVILRADMDAVELEWSDGTGTFATAGWFPVSLSGTAVISS